MSDDRPVLNYATPKPKGFFWGIIADMMLSVLGLLPYLVIGGLLAFLVLLINGLIRS